MKPVDNILERFFELERWQRAIDGGIDKGINRPLLREMAKPETRIALYRAIARHRYDIDPPRAVQIPKDTHGNLRTIYVNTPADRIILAITNQLLFDLMPGSVHPSCKSYLSGTGCGRVAIDVARYLTTIPMTDQVVGWKGDLSKYFDSVPIEFIDQAFDRIEQRHGPSALVDMIRRYYHDDAYIDHEGSPAHRFMSLKQGCAVSAWLADVLLYHIDDRLSQLDGYYVRYCDDMVFMGPDHGRALTILRDELSKMRLSLHPDKLETLKSNRWFTFLGYSICGKQISLSPNRLRKFKQAIDRETAKSRGIAQATRRVNRLLYHGHDDYSWARTVLPVINCQRDIDTLNAYVMDAIRASHSGKRRIGGLGYDPNGIEGCIVRGKGRHVGSNRYKTPPRIGGYLTLGCMRKALKTSRAAYETLVRQI